jgi:hypothetical protein
MTGVRTGETRSVASAVRLREETRGLNGLVAVTVAERTHPLWLRAGTADVDRAIAMLDPAARGLKCAHEPRRILEIGAGTGHRTAALATLYPGAEILATEADPGLHRTGQLNTLSYSNVTYLGAAPSTAEEQYGYFGRQGPLGMPVLIAHQAGPVRSRKLSQLLSFYRFTDPDTLIITPDAASAAILREPLPWALRLIAVETGGEPLPADMARCYPLSQFVTIISGDYVLLYRRAEQRLPPVPRPVALLAPDGPARHLQLENTGTDGFFHLPGGGVRLHPNAPDAPPARLSLSAEMCDHAELQVSLRVAQENAPPVRFTVKLVNEAGRVLALGTELLTTIRPRAMVLPLPSYTGRCEVIFITEIAALATTAAGAWAEIISATLV